MSKWIGRGVGIALLAGAGILLFTYEPPEPEAPPPVVRPAKVMVLESPATAAARRYPGRVHATERVDLSFRVSGPLIELSAKPNDDVVKDQVLARIDPRDFETRVAQIQGNLAQEQARLSAMRVGARPEDIAILKSQLAAAKARLDRASEEFEREKKLLASGAGTRSAYDAAKAALDIATQGVNAADESLKRGEAGARKEDIESQEARIVGLQASLKAARDALADTELRAPFAGKIARTYVENFEDVKAKQPILSLQDVSSVEIVADVPEAVVAVVTRDKVQRLTATFDFLQDRTFEVAYQEAEVEADRRTQTYAVTLVMPAPKDVKILPGMTATVQVELKSGADAAPDRWLVPAAAVLAGADGKPSVWRVDPGSMQVQRTPVTVADMKGDRIWVTEGLKPGDMIVVAGARLLVEGQKVRRLEPKAP